MYTYIREWYAKEHPEDEAVNKLGLIKEDVTFGDVWEALQEKQDVYKVLGCDSSKVRKSVFDELAWKMNCSYDTIYNMYLDKDYRNNTGNDTKSYLISVPVEGFLEIISEAPNEMDLVFDVYDKILEADFGALKNIQTGIEGLSDTAAIQVIPDILKSSDTAINFIDDKHKIINFPVKGDVIMSVNASSSKAALTNAMNMYDNIKHQITSDATVLGDLKEPVILKNGIKTYDFNKQSVNTKKNEGPELG